MTKQTNQREAFEKLEELLPDFQYVDSEYDRVVLTVGLRASFYFWNGHSAKTRAKLVACVEAYEEAHGERLNWAMHPESLQAVKLADPRWPPFRKYVASLDEDDSIELYASSGEDEDAAGEYKMEAITERGWQEGRMSVFSFTLPRGHAFLQGKREKFLELFRFCVSQLDPFHAHAGLAATSTYSQEDWQADELDLASRYRGLYIEATVIDLAIAPAGLKSVDWITFIGNQLTTRVGGAAALTRRIQARDLPAEIMPAGVLIVASVVPDIGAVEDDGPMSLIKLNSVLRPLRNGNVGSMGFGSVGGETRFNRCTSDLWVRRFDAPGVWPPATFAGLPKAELGLPPKQRLSLKGGEVCQVHGRYGITDAPGVEDDDDLMPVVILMPGDIAPGYVTLGPHGEFVSCVPGKWELLSELA